MAAQAASAAKECCEEKAAQAVSPMHVQAHEVRPHGTGAGGIGRLRVY